MEDPGEKRVLSPNDYKGADLEAIFRDKDVEVIEVKKRLNRLVFGQAIAGADMFERQYQPRNISPVVVYEIGDPAMEWVCRKHGVNTVSPPGRSVDISETGEEEQ